MEGSQAVDQFEQSVSSVYERVLELVDGERQPQVSLVECGDQVLARSVEEGIEVRLGKDENRGVVNFSERKLVQIMTDERYEGIRQEKRLAMLFAKAAAIDSEVFEEVSDKMKKVWGKDEELWSPSDVLQECARVIGNKKLTAVVGDLRSTVGLALELGLSVDDYPSYVGRVLPANLSNRVILMLGEKKSDFSSWLRNQEGVRESPHNTFDNNLAYFGNGIKFEY